MNAPKRRKTWPLFLIGLPAAVAVWSGWVGLGELCGFGIIHPLPGIWDNLKLNTAITLPIGVEAYGGYALGIWADIATPRRVRKFAFRSAIGSLLLGLLGQVVFHLLSAAGYAHAPWPVVVFVSCIPVAALGFGMGLHSLLTHTEADEAQEEPAAELAPASPVSRVAVLDSMAGEITPGAPECPDPGPDRPLPEAEDEIPDAGIEAVLDAWDRPVVPRRPVPVPDRTIDEEAAELFGTGPVRPDPPRAAAPVPPPADRTMKPDQAAWIDETDPAEVARLARTLSRNKLADHFGIGRPKASRLKAEHGQPALNGSG